MSENKTILTTRRFERWWRKAQGWFATQFASINVDLTPVEEKIDALVENMPSEEALKERYNARFEQNNDGDDTHTCVLPLVAGVEEGDSEAEVIVAL